jgi:hypothetical protein
MAYEFHEDRPVNESGGAEVSGGLVRGGRGAGAGPEPEEGRDPGQAGGGGDQEGWALE